MMKSLWIAVLMLLPSLALAQRGLPMGGEDSIFSRPLIMQFIIPMSIHVYNGKFGDFETTHVWGSGGQYGYWPLGGGTNGSKISVHSQGGFDSIALTIDTASKMIYNLTYIEKGYSRGFTIPIIPYTIEQSGYLSAIFRVLGKDTKSVTVTYCDDFGGTGGIRTGCCDGLIPDSTCYVQIGGGAAPARSVIRNHVTGQPAIMVEYVSGFCVVKSKFIAGDMKREMIVRDALGRMIASKSVLPNETEAEFTIASWPTGVYFLSLGGSCAKILIS